jgi:CDP-glucose 4,6-dehydratase
MNVGFWRGRRVFVTGHTGFKGGWLSLWLHSLGAEVHGYALQPPTQPSLFGSCGIAGMLASHTVADVRDAAALREAMRSAQPEVVLHLAAQPLDRASYRDAAGTFATNVLGTVHLLEAVRACADVRAVVSVTSDKCYENDGRRGPYVEGDPMGGHDPYSASKGCAELVTASYARSFLAAAGVGVATARAGNVIGGGDWAEDRLVPDAIRAAARGEPLEVRSPGATRPWQHVLEPLSGYLLLAEALCERPSVAAGAWNFGPDLEDVRPVSWVLDALCTLVPGASWHAGTASGPHEAALLSLDSSKARAQLGWSPTWTLREAIERTAEWHARWRPGTDMSAFTRSQVEAFGSARQRAGSAG